MKRFLCLLLVVLLIAPSALAEDIDYSQKTVPELISILDKVRNELNKKITKAAENEYILEDEDIEIYMTGKGHSGDMKIDGRPAKYFEIEIVVVNNSSQALSILFDHCSVNGWELSYVSSISSIAAGKKRKDGISLNLTEADLEDFHDMKDIEIEFHTIDENYRTVKKYGPIIIDFDGEAWK